MKQRQVRERLCAAQGRWTVGAPPWILCEYSKKLGRYGHTVRQLQLAGPMAWGAGHSSIRCESCSTRMP